MFIERLSNFFELLRLKLIQFIISPLKVKAQIEDSISSVHSNISEGFVEDMLERTNNLIQ